ncbi:hypothetical protein G7085_05040 [Tessaracoccus sp. HDW20]|uniref:hypothetical protein n=1 Tax=Tessaracoccus coleopterorum TaxID=2714950 RepID=UPI0018D2C678|nr:hypothetical protein [Tessaracoccus coleopterorum]NHB84204.1 hypothetical protein [Tessaracoccus coleopterorum]
MEITNYHGDRTDWSIRIGTMSTQVLGGSARPSMYGHDELGRYDRKGCDPTDEGIAGSVSPVQGPPDFPRVLAELEAAHPALRYDYAKLSASGRPGRLLPPTRKRQLISWLSRA